MAQPNAFDGMMYEFCVGLGWCGRVRDGKPQRVADFIPEDGQVTADEFVRWLITAENCDPDEGTPQMRRWKRDLRAVFVKHMGAEAVDASELHGHF